MARRIRNGSRDSRDWWTRANDDRAIADTMPEGAARDDAIKKSEQLRSAAEMMDYLKSSDPKPPR